MAELNCNQNPHCCLKGIADTSLVGDVLFPYHEDCVELITQTLSSCTKYSLLHQMCI